MIVASNLLIGIANVVSVVLTIYYWLILVRALISWVQPDPLNPIVQFLHRVTEPLLAPARKMLPFSLTFGIDISPIIVFLAILFIKSFLIQTLYDIALKLR